MTLRTNQPWKVRLFDEFSAARMEKHGTKKLWLAWIRILKKLWFCSAGLVLVMANKVNLDRRILLGSWLGTDMFDHHRWVGKLLHSYMGCELYTHLKIFQKCYCHLEIKVFEQGFHSWSRNSHPFRSIRCPTKPDYSLVTNCKISYTLFFFPDFICLLRFLFFLWLAIVVTLILDLQH